MNTFTDTLTVQPWQLLQPKFRKPRLEDFSRVMLKGDQKRWFGPGAMGDHASRIFHYRSNPDSSFPDVAPPYSVRVFHDDLTRIEVRWPRLNTATLMIERCRIIISLRRLEVATTRTRNPATTVYLLCPSCGRKSRYLSLSPETLQCRLCWASKGIQRRILGQPNEVTRLAIKGRNAFLRLRGSLLDLSPLGDWDQPPRAPRRIRDYWALCSTLNRVVMQRELEELGLLHLIQSETIGKKEN